MKRNKCFVLVPENLTMKKAVYHEISLLTRQTSPNFNYCLTTDCTSYLLTYYNSVNYIYTWILRLILPGVLLFQVMDVFSGCSNTSPTANLPSLKKKPSVQLESPASFTSNNTFGARQKCVKGDARALMSRGGAGSGGSPIAAAIYTLKVVSLLFHTHTSLWPFTQIPLCRSICIFASPPLLFHARFFLQCVSPGCTLTQRAPQTPRTFISSSGSLSRLSNEWMWNPSGVGCLEEKLMTCNLTLCLIVFHWTASYFTSKSRVEISSVQSGSSSTCFLGIWREQGTSWLSFQLSWKQESNSAAVYLQGARYFPTKTNRIPAGPCSFPCLFKCLSNQIEGNCQQIV